MYTQATRTCVPGLRERRSCWSDQCKAAPSFHLGPVAPIPTTYLEQVEHVHMKYLTRDKHVATAGNLDNLFQRREEEEGRGCLQAQPGH